MCIYIYIYIKFFYTRILAAEVLDKGQEAIEWVTSKGKEKKGKKDARAGAVSVAPAVSGAVFALENGAGKSPSTQEKKSYCFQGRVPTKMLFLKYVCVCVCVSTNSEKSRL